MEGIIGAVHWQDFIDIAVIAFIIYRLLILLVDTRAMQLVKGLLIIGVLFALARLMELTALSWILGRMLGVFIIAIPIVFQPEIRRMLEELGRGNIWRRRQVEERAAQLTDEISEEHGNEGYLAFRCSDQRRYLPGSDSIHLLARESAA